MTWNTLNEISFLRGLGYHRDRYSSQKGPSRLTLLKSYRASLGLRRRWEGLDKQRILAEVDLQISNLEKSAQYEKTKET